MLGGRPAAAAAPVGRRAVEDAELGAHGDHLQRRVVVAAAGLVGVGGGGGGGEGEGREEGGEE